MPPWRRLLPEWFDLFLAVFYPDHLAYLHWPDLLRRVVGLVLDQLAGDDVGYAEHIIVILVLVVDTWLDGFASEHHLFPRVLPRLRCRSLPWMDFYVVILSGFQLSEVPYVMVAKFQFYFDQQLCDFSELDYHEYLPYLFP